MKSIRTYLLVRVVASAALVLALAGVVLWVALASALEGQFDRSLTDRVQGFASILFQVEDHVEFQFSEQIMPEYAGAERPDYFELWFRDGGLLERSESLEDLGEAGDLVLEGEPGAAPMHWTAPLPDGRQGRFVAQIIEVHHLYPEEGPDRPDAKSVLVVIARGREALVAAERRVLLAISGSFLALLALIAALAWFSVQRGLAPAQRFAAELDAIHVEHLPEHFHSGEVPAELGPIARKTDALIRRVGLALDRERRTTADIAHELRTPISELLIVAEVALRAGDTEEVRKALETVRAVAQRMGHSVSTLLKLARLEMGTEEFEHADVDLGALVQELMPSLVGVARQRNLELDCAIESGTSVKSDGDVLRIVLSNLLGNAMNYALLGSTVSCRLEHVTGGWRLVVENQTDELRSDDLRSLAEPFWRKDQARADRDRSGLGLALSRTLAESAGLGLLFELDGATFRAILSGSGSMERQVRTANRPQPVGS